MAGYKKYKDELSQENQTEKRGTLRNSQGNRTSDISTKAPTYLEDSSHVPHHITKAIQRN